MQEIQRIKSQLEDNNIIGETHSESLYFNYCSFRLWSLANKIKQDFTKTRKIEHRFINP